MQTARRIFGIVAAAAVFLTSLTSVIDCANLCVLTSAGTSNCRRTAAQAPLCHGNSNTHSACLPSDGPEHRRDCPSRNCPGQHLVSTLQARMAPALTLPAGRGSGSDARLDPWSPSSAPQFLPKVPLRCRVSHPPPSLNGPSIRTLQSLFRV